MMTHIFFHPDYTVGPGFSPGLLTLQPQALAGSATSWPYRRWGISPRPEDVIKLSPVAKRAR
jgi:hypothetical protein